MIFFVACDCVKCLVLKGFVACQQQIRKKVSFGECFLLAIRSRPWFGLCMSDTLDIHPTASAGQNSGKMTSQRYGSTYELHSEIAGVKVWKRIYDGRFSRAGGDAWLAGHLGFKSLAAVRAYFAHFGITA